MLHKSALQTVSFAYTRPGRAAMRRADNLHSVRAMALTGFRIRWGSRKVNFAHIVNIRPQAVKNKTAIKRKVHKTHR